MQILCKQNPKTPLDCYNCKSIEEVKSLDFFKTRSYKHECKKCGSESIYDTSKVAEKFEKQLKSIGVTW